MIDDDYFLIDFDRSVVYLADADTSYIFIVVDGTDKNLCACVRVACGSRYVLYDCIEERCHILVLDGELRAGCTCFGGGVDERAVQLLVIGIQIHE